MRHRRNDTKLGRTTAHRKATMSALVCSLIREKRIKTTVTKAKEARKLAERMITVARQGTLSARRKAASELGRASAVTVLFDELVPQFEGRAGGYTRVLKLGRRSSDGSEMALLEWVGVAIPDKTRAPKSEEPA